MANITPINNFVAVDSSKDLEPSWNYWVSLKTTRKTYLKSGLMNSELLNELRETKKTIAEMHGASKVGKKQWNKYIELAFNGNEGIEYVDLTLKAFELNGFKVPTEEMVTAALNPQKVVKKANISPKEMKPIAVSINKSINPNWSYWDSVKKTRKLYLKWATVSPEILRELYIAKQAITKGGVRKCGLPKKGEMSWNRYCEEAFGGMVTKRTIDSHLLAYQKNGCQKPEKVTVNAIQDYSKVVIKSHVVEADGRIKLEIYLPEHEVTYIQRIPA